jgi:hypothetical protein
MGLPDGAARRGCQTGLPDGVPDGVPDGATSLRDHRPLSHADDRPKSDPDRSPGEPA